MGGQAVMLSFGGAGMNECWHTCIGKAASVVEQLGSLVRPRKKKGWRWKKKVAP